MSKRIVIINGPNLNLLGKREKHIYGSQNFETFFESIKQNYQPISFEYFQSNVEGEIVNFIQENGFNKDAIILNAAAYSHTSIAIADAVAAIETPTVGVHISNIYQREKERHVDLLAKSCKACLFGFGLSGYEMAIEFFIKQWEEEDV